MAEETRNAYPLARVYFILKNPGLLVEFLEYDWLICI